MSHWIDTHTHIYSSQFDKDREEVLERSRANGVEQLFMPNVDYTTIDAMLEVESRWAWCSPMMGLHPCSVKKNFERELYTVEEWLARRKFSAVGEIGTDRYWDTTFWDQQCEAFTIQVRWAKQFALPVVIHSRESMDETITLVESLQDGTLTGVFHCFTGTVEQARRIIALNFHLGIGGVSTFSKGGLDGVLPEVPLEHIVLETDSPYLAPVPHRGKRNEPSYIPLIARRVSEIMHVSTDELQRRTTENALKLFAT